MAVAESDERRHPWLRTLLVLAAFVYVTFSAVALDALAASTQLCSSGCPPPWTVARVAVWTGWTFLGLLVVSGGAVAGRPRRGLLAPRRVAAAAGASVVLAGLCAALMIRSTEAASLSFD